MPPTVWAEEGKAPVLLKADQLQYFKGTDTYLATGSVSIRQGPKQVDADSLRLKGKTGRVDAFGNVHFFDGENAIEANRITFNIDSELGVLYQGKLFLKKDNYHIEGEKIVRSAIDHYELESGSFTACDCQTSPAWRFRAEALSVTTDEYLFGRNVVFYLKDIPVFYIPYFIYPVKRERQTGLLVPHIGYSTRYGLRYRQDFFWAISGNQDATISFDLRGDTGNGGGLEYRYVWSKNTHGQLNTSYFRDQENALDRWELRYSHEQRFSKRVSGKLDMVYINENDHFQNLSDQTADRALQNIESNLFLTYEGQSSFAYLLARYTQALTSPSNDDTPQRLPEIGYNVIEYRPGKTPFHLNLDSSAVHFWSEGELNLYRVDLYPSAALPIHLGSLATLTPWIGFRETWYEHGAASLESFSRKVIPSGVTLETQAYKRWTSITHTISGSVFYEHILVSGDNDVPQIDELDTLQDRETLTLSLVQRLLTLGDDANPREKAILRLTESLHLDRIPAAALDSRRFSDLRGELKMLPLPHFKIEVDAFYNVYNGKMTSINTDLKLSLMPYLNLSIGQRTTRAGPLAQKGDLFNPYYIGDKAIIGPDIDFWSEEISIDTPWGIRFINRVYFDADQDETVEVDYILTFQEQCWGFSFSFIEFHDRREFSFLITLQGLGSLSPDS
ncbi:MAG: LPS-assembly protein LptD [Nitrospiria bacterium]